MSIRDLINSHLEQRLWVLSPRIESDPVVRTLVISAEVKAVLDGPWPSVKAERRCGELRADLEAFVKGERVSICLTPYKAGDAYLGRLDPPADEVWDVRSRKPRPGLRILGRFAEPDVFVGLTCWPRSREVDFLSRPPLGEGASKEWNLAKMECKSEWRKLFHTYPAHGNGSDRADAYLTCNFILV